MLIYLKITVALAASAVLIESNALLGRDGLGNFVMAFVHAGFLLAGAFYIVSAAEKYITRQKISNYRKFSRSAKLREPARQIQPVYSAIKIVR